MINFELSDWTRSRINDGPCSYNSFTYKINLFSTYLAEILYEAQVGPCFVELLKRNQMKQN